MGGWRAGNLGNVSIEKPLCTSCVPVVELVKTAGVRNLTPAFDFSFGEWSLQLDVLTLGGLQNVMHLNRDIGLCC
jgi:hypothetical protein